MGTLNYAPRTIHRALVNKLKIEFNSSGDPVGWYILDGKAQFKIKVSQMHRTWSPGVIRDVMRRIRLNNSEFRDLVNCPMSASDYEALIRARLNLGEAPSS